MAVPSVVSKFVRGLSAGLVAVLAVQVAGAVPAHAVEDDFSIADMRDVAATDLVAGGPAGREAAEAALVGSDADVRAYFDSGYHVAQETDERSAVQVLAGLDGPATRAAGLAALDRPRAEMQAFAKAGWHSAWESDERLRTYRVLQAGRAGGEGRGAAGAGR
jgi:hypothetical protein